MIGTIIFAVGIALVIGFVFTIWQWFDYHRNGALSLSVENRLITRTEIIALGIVVVLLVFVAIQYGGVGQ